MCEADSNLLTLDNSLDKSRDLATVVMVATEAGEKERVASWSVQGETILDMYAGMGCPSRQQYN